MTSGSGGLGGRRPMWASDAARRQWEARHNPPPPTPNTPKPEVKARRRSKTRARRARSCSTSRRLTRSWSSSSSGPTSTDFATVRRSNRGWTVIHIYAPNAPTGPLTATDSHHGDLVAALDAAERRNLWRDERRAADQLRHQRRPWRGSSGGELD